MLQDLIRQIYQLMLSELLSVIFGEPTQSLSKREKIIFVFGLIIGLLVSDYLL